MALVTRHRVTGRKKEINSALWKRLQPLLPVVKPSPQGGRPRLDDELALNGILFVLRTGIAWEDLPQELGLWQRHDVLAQAARMAGRGGVAPAAPDATGRAARCRASGFQSREHR
jgi:transposase